MNSTEWLSPAAGVKAYILDGQLHSWECLKPLKNGYYNNSS